MDLKSNLNSIKALFLNLLRFVYSKIRKILPRIFEKKKEIVCVWMSKKMLTHDKLKFQKQKFLGRKQ